MIIQQIKTILDEGNYHSSILTEGENSKLIVFLGLDPHEKEEILEIRHAQLPVISDSPPLHRIEFKILLPFKVKDSSLNQVGNLLLFINQLSDLPGFELDQLEGKVFYRYVGLVPIINQTLIATIIGAVKLSLTLFRSSIESLAIGKLSFNDLLKEIIQISNQNK